VPQHEVILTRDDIVLTPKFNRQLTIISLRTGCIAHLHYAQSPQHSIGSQGRILSLQEPLGARRYAGFTDKFPARSFLPKKFLYRALRLSPSSKPTHTQFLGSSRIIFGSLVVATRLR